MARTVGTLRVKFKWWVRPFLALGVIAVYPFAPVMDDWQLEGYCERIAQIVATHGIKCMVI